MGGLTKFVQMLRGTSKKKGQWGYSGYNRLIRLPKPSKSTPKFSMLFSTPHEPEVIATPKTRKVRAV